jgi:hypothetical protein
LPQPTRLLAGAVTVLPQFFADRIKRFEVEALAQSIVVLLSTTN